MFDHELILVFVEVLKGKVFVLFGDCQGLLGTFPSALGCHTGKLLCVAFALFALTLLLLENSLFLTKFVAFSLESSTAREVFQSSRGVVCIVKVLVVVQPGDAFQQIFSYSGRFIAAEPHVSNLSGCHFGHKWDWTNLVELNIDTNGSLLSFHAEEGRLFDGDLIKVEW